MSRIRAEPWSMDGNLAYCSYGAGILEDQNAAPPDNMRKLAVDPTKAPPRRVYDIPQPILYNSLSPEREFLELSIVASQKTVNGQVRSRVYKNTFCIPSCSSGTGKLYGMSGSSMDRIGGFAPVSTTGFISVQAIRLKKYG
ncbi:MAG: argininosuccinate synthetase [Trichoglossum hirsutum]|nr:MAG: argininosuccinate synthetase [Trichoglossum hirsutum]